MVVDLFRTFRAVFRTRLSAFGNACGIERSANNMITDARQVSYPAASDENGTVLLQVVTFAGDVDSSFLLVGQTDSCNFTHSGVRLFRRSRRNRQTYAASLRAFVQNRRFALFDRRLSAMLDELVDRWHCLPPCNDPEYQAVPPEKKKRIRSFCARYACARDQKGIISLNDFCPFIDFSI